MILDLENVWFLVCFSVFFQVRAHSNLVGLVSKLSEVCTYLYISKTRSQAVLLWDEPDKKIKFKKHKVKHKKNYLNW